MSQYLVTPGQLERILHRRALGDRVQDIAEAYKLEPPQISRLIHKDKAHFLRICKKLGVKPPRPGGKRKGSGRKEVSDEKKARYTVNYHPYAKKPEIEFVTLVCLKCREKFESEDRINERICSKCKDGAIWQAGADYSISRVKVMEHS